MNYNDMTIDCHIWDAMLDHNQRYMPKMTNRTEMKSCFVDDLE